VVRAGFCFRFQARAPGSRLNKTALMYLLN
jgi:hypothetical protein